LDQVAGTEDTLVQWHAHDTDATRATVFIATANVIKTLALMRASQVRRRVCFFLGDWMGTVRSGE
jgi:hypothetical protein